MGLESAITRPIAGLAGATNKYNARPATLDESQYGAGITDAQKATLAQMQANAGGGADMAEFAQALKAQAAGNGPSLAQRQLDTATQQNAARAASAVASMRGINPALAARMIAQNQAATNQEAAGQAATTRLSEQLQTQSLLGQALEARRAQDLAAQQANTSTLGTLGGLQQGQNSLRVQNQLGAEQINAGVASQNAETNKQIFGGIMQGVGAAMQGAGSGGGGGGMNVGSFMGKAHGGEIERPLRLMGGGSVWQKILEQVGKGYSAMGKRLEEEKTTDAADRFSGGPRAGPPQVASPEITTPSLDTMGGYGQMVGAPPVPTATTPPTLDSMRGYGTMPGAGPVPPQPTEDMQITAPTLDSMRGYGASPGMARGGAIDFRAGGPVPGKAAVRGNSPKNDTVPAMVSPGEIVLPRTVAQAPDAPEQAAAFVRAIKAKKGGGADASGFARVLEAQRRLYAAMADGGQIPGVDDDSLGAKFHRWWTSQSPDDTAEAAKQVDAKAIDSTTGLLKRAAAAARKHNQALDDADRAAAAG